MSSLNHAPPSTSSSSGLTVGFGHVLPSILAAQHVVHIFPGDGRLPCNLCAQGTRNRSVLELQPGPRSLCMVPMAKSGQHPCSPVYLLVDAIHVRAALAEVPQLLAVVRQLHCEGRSRTQARCGWQQAAGRGANNAIEPSSRALPTHASTRPGGEPPPPAAPTPRLTQQHVCAGGAVGDHGGRKAGLPADSGGRGVISVQDLPAGGVLEVSEYRWS